MTLHTMFACAEEDVVHWTLLGAGNRRNDLAYTVRSVRLRMPRTGVVVWAHAPDYSGRVVVGFESPEDIAAQGGVHLVVQEFNLPDVVDWEELEHKVLCALLQ